MFHIVDGNYSLDYIQRSFGQWSSIGKAENIKFTSLNKDIYKTIKRLKEYIPHYELVMPPTINNDVLVLSIKVKGTGDYLPEYAGNLDIINCAAIEISKNLL